MFNTHFRQLPSPYMDAVFTAVKPYYATGFTGHTHTVTRTVNQQSEGLTVRVRSRIYGTRIHRIYGDGGHPYGEQQVNILV